MLKQLSYRIKTPLALVLVILVATVLVSALSTWRSYQDARESFIAQAGSLGRVLSRTLRPALVHDDTWQAYEILRTPLESGEKPGRDFVLLDKSGRVFAASDPRRFPVLARFSAGSLEAASFAATGAHAQRIAEDAEGGYLYVTTPVLAEDGAPLGQLVQRYDTALLKPRLEEVSQGMLLASLAALLLLLPIGWLAGKRLAEPLASGRMSRPHRSGIAGNHPMRISRRPRRDQPARQTHP